MKSNPLLAWYRVLAIATGSALLIFCGFLIAKYGFDKGSTTAIAVVHGWLYVTYFVVTFLLGQKLKWPMGRLVFTLAAGCIPFASFYAERRVVREAAAVAPVKEPVSV